MNCIHCGHPKDDHSNNWCPSPGNNNEFRAWLETFFESEEDPVDIMRDAYRIGVKHADDMLLKRNMHPDAHSLMILDMSCIYALGKSGKETAEILAVLDNSRKKP